MFDAGAPFEQGDWKTRSAEETVSFLNENFGPDDCDRLAFVACMINVAIYEKRPNEALYWSIVFARREPSVERRSAPRAASASRRFQKVGGPAAADPRAI